jgi:uncharacterized membrane protein YgdD (TMEM256/DUF423 family)
MDAARIWLLAASLLGALGVLLGAFGAHGLRDRLTPDQLASWSTAVHYHQLHSVALLALALWASSTAKSVQLPASLFAAGIVLFSGSIYGLLLTEQRWLGPVTPLGGLCFVAGWLSLSLLAFRGD